MQWWNDVVEWFSSDQGQQVVTLGIVPFVSILVSGIIAALIGRSAVRRLIARQDREARSSAIAAILTVGQKATVWSTLSAQEKERVEYLAGEADARIRLLPLAGASVAADWSAYQLATMKRTSASYAFQAEETFRELREGLIGWQRSPKRARKLFAQNLTAWSYDADPADAELVAKQDQWAREHEATAVLARPEQTSALPTQEPTER